MPAEPLPLVRLLLLVVLLPLGACSSALGGDPREVVLEARGMTFVSPGDPEAPNPELQFRAGEEVTVVLHNDAPGLLHDFAIPAWNVHTEQIRAGERAEVTFTVPATPGRTAYECRPHAELMKGTVVVTP